jgi:hypothetical protein
MFSSQMKTFPALSFKMTTRNLILTATQWTNMCICQLTTNSNRASTAYLISFVLGNLISNCDPKVFFFMLRRHPRSTLEPWSVTLLIFKSLESRSWNQYKILYIQLCVCLCVHTYAHKNQIVNIRSTLCQCNIFLASKGFRLYTF